MIKLQMTQGQTCYNSYNPEILKLILQPKNILDIGCGTGLLAEEIKKRQRCFVAGIEKDSQAAFLAEKRCDKVIVGDIETLGQLPFSRQYFDFIVLADILEHTKDPGSVLESIKPYLAEGGFMLISLPNIAHWRMRLKLMFGNFDYQERGTLDKTHLRFFTLKTFKALLEFCGLEIIGLNGYGNFLANTFKGLFASFFVVKVRLITK